MSVSSDKVFDIVVLGKNTVKVLVVSCRHGLPGSLEKVVYHFLRPLW